MGRAGCWVERRLGVARPQLERLPPYVPILHPPTPLPPRQVDTLERKVLEGVSRVLGPAVWDNAVLGFTRASEASAPAGVAFDDWVEQRAAALRAAIRRAGGAADAELAVALIENSSRCPTNEEGEKVVPGEVPWLVDLVEKVGGGWG